MARIAGVDLPREKRVEIGLTYIYGIGLTTSKKILAETGINPDTRVKDLDEKRLSFSFLPLSIASSITSSCLQLREQDLYAYERFSSCFVRVRASLFYGGCLYNIQFP